MKNILYIVLGIAIVIIIIMVGKNWSKIMASISGNSKPIQCAEGEELVSATGGFVCMPKVQQDPEPRPQTQAELQVSNPNGAVMYYQSDLASGGKLYSASNVVIPYGTKLKLIKTWQTNVSTQPFVGYYETDDKKYGAQSGFYATQDILKL